jgi:hypothetical protein
MYSFQVIKSQATASIWVFGKASSKALVANLINDKILDKPAKIEQ